MRPKKVSKSNINSRSNEKTKADPTQGVSRRDYMVEIDEFFKDLIYWEHITSIRNISPILGIRNVPSIRSLPFTHSPDDPLFQLLVPAYQPIPHALDLLLSIPSGP